MSKICSTCKEEKPLSCFYRDKGAKDGCAYVCKECTKDRVRKWKVSNIEKTKDYHRNYQKDKQKELKDYRKKYYLANRQKLIIQSKERYYSDLEKSKADRADWRARNKEYTKRFSRDYKRIRRALDTDFRLTENIRSRLNSAIKGKAKSGSSIKDLGCTVSELRLHLENQFQPKMSWENYGEWHIDHIYPLSEFDLSDPEQVKKSCHFTNLQPLWAEDNIRKGNKSCGH